ncbi:MAG: helix-turn-helix transcriptional regulator [Clostridiales bacterium]|nr:helix-turn-helix transcriptional regulator [Clostridiales bacterium]
MILSSKITELRKRNGLSQEELGDKIGVSRQAVSKWEMGSAVPDINKIMAMAKYFGVSTDFLLKDEYDLSYLDGGKVDSVEAPDRRIITSEGIRSYLDTKRKLARNCVVVIFLVLSSAVPGILISLADESKAAIGAVIETIVLVIAAVIAILSLNSLSGFKYIKNKDAELDYGVRGIVEEQKSKFESTHLLGIIIGVVLLSAEVLPLMIVSLIAEGSDSAIVIGGLITIFMFAAGLSLIVYVCVINNGFKRVLKIR